MTLTRSPAKPFIDRAYNERRKVQPILDYLEKRNAITPQEAQKVTGKSPATVRRYLALMCERGILESLGSTSLIIYYAPTDRMLKVLLREYQGKGSRGY
jgi:Fic family protein